MRIEFDGHVHSMSMNATAPLDVSIELHVEGIRSIPNITVNASHAEVAHYKVGMPIKIQIRPNNDARVEQCTCGYKYKSGKIEFHVCP